MYYTCCVVHVMVQIQPVYTYKMALQELADHMTLQCFCLSYCSRHVTQVLKANLGPEVSNRPMGGHLSLPEVSNRSMGGHVSLPEVSNRPMGRKLSLPEVSNRPMGGHLSLE